MRLRIFKIIPIALIFFAVPAVFADVVTFKGGKKLTCKVITQERDYIVVDSSVGELKFFRFEFTDLEIEPSSQAYQAALGGMLEAAAQPKAVTLKQKQELNNTAAVLPLESAATQANLSLTAKEETNKSESSNLTVSIQPPAIQGPDSAEIQAENKTVVNVSGNNTSQEIKISPVKVKIKRVGSGLPVILVIAVIIVVILVSFLSKSGVAVKAQADYAASRGSAHLKQMATAIENIHKKIGEFKEEEKKLREQDSAQLNKLGRDMATVEKLSQIVTTEKNNLEKIKVSHFIKAYKGDKESVQLVNKYVLGVYPQWGKPPAWFKVMLDKYCAGEQ